jgi:intracellular septation protein A
MLQLDTYIIDYTYQLQKEEYIQEKNVIHNILNNNSFPIQPWKIPKPKQNQTIYSQIEIPTQKWATFTYIGKETTYVIKIFKYTQI